MELYLHSPYTFMGWCFYHCVATEWDDVAVTVLKVLSQTSVGTAAILRFFVIASGK
jgi:hypothetical protein